MRRAYCELEVIEALDAVAVGSAVGTVGVAFAV
jgi:hypothetical protein